MYSGSQQERYDKWRERKRRESEERKQRKQKIEGYWKRLSELVENANKEDKTLRNYLMGISEYESDLNKLFTYLIRLLLTN